MTISMGNDEKKKCRVALKLLLGVVLLCFSVKVLSEKVPDWLNSYEASWYKQFLPEKLEGMSYAEMVNEVGPPKYAMPSEGGRVVCVFEPYSRLGWIGRYMCRWRYDPMIGIVFENDRYSGRIETIRTRFPGMD
jgi:hypothetical protein